MNEQEILDRMASRKAHVEKIAKLYSSKTSKVNKLANIKRGNNAEVYDIGELDKTFALTVKEGVNRAKRSASRLVSDKNPT